MSAFSLIYPSPSLARLADPLKLAARSAREGRTLELEEAVSLAADRIGKELRTVIPRKFDADASPDERWYWLAPFLLDAKDPEIRSDEWLARRGEPWVRSQGATPMVNPGGDTDEADGLMLHEVVSHVRDIALDPGGSDLLRTICLEFSPGLPSRHQLSAPSDPWHARPVRQTTAPTSPSVTGRRALHGASAASSISLKS